MSGRPPLWCFITFAQFTPNIVGYCEGCILQTLPFSCVRARPRQTLSAEIYERARMAFFSPSGRCSNASSNTSFFRSHLAGFAAAFFCSFKSAIRRFSQSLVTSIGASGRSSFTSIGGNNVMSLTEISPTPDGSCFTHN